MITSADITFQVRTAVEAAGDQAHGIDVAGIVGEIKATYGLVDIETVPDAEFWTIVARHDATQAESPYVDLRSAQEAAWLAAMPQLASNGHQLIVRGTAVELTNDALDVLAELPEDHDGHFDGQHIWIGGTESLVIR